jgi:hypothetical protein
MAFSPSKSNAQIDALELMPSAVIPISTLGENFKTGFGINANYFIDDDTYFASYAGLGFYRLLLSDPTENSHSNFFSIPYYSGIEGRLPIGKQFHAFVGGALGMQWVFYSSNWVNGGSGALIEPFIGVIPKLGFQWRVNDGWFALSAQFKYSAYLSLYGAYYNDTFADRFHQFIQPSLGMKIYI